MAYTPNQQFAEDAAHVSGDQGTVALGVRRDADTSPVSADGDFHTPIFDALGNQKVNVKAIAAGENHVGEIGTASDLIDVTLTLDTSAYIDGDVFCDTATLSNAVRVNGGRGILQSIVVLDEDDVGQTIDFVFFSVTQSLGTKNSTPNISDANARDCLGAVRVASSDYLDFGGVKVATKTGIGLHLEAASGSRNLFLGGIIRGAGTYTASGVRLRLGILWD